jgi:bidirectional [NiFe] hydrogenase diaphorase subunit
MQAQAAPARPQAPTPTEIAAGDRRFKRLDMILKRNHYRADALIEVLHGAQEIFGYLETGVLFYIGRSLKLPLSRVYGAATFYHLFSLKPSSEHSCVVCLGTACYVKGSDKVMAALEQKLGIRSGETRADGRVSLFAARCLGACGVAPVVVFDGAIASNQTPDTALQQIDAWTLE